VISVAVTEWSGHVFNLSTPHGYFTANGGHYTGNTLKSANEGQRELWRQGQESGQIPADAKRVWIATPDERTRPEHMERDGHVVGIDESWPWGEEPGGSPNCRCAAGLATPEDIARAET
jgi:hypothetical protein